MAVILMALMPQVGQEGHAHAESHDKAQASNGARQAGGDQQADPSSAAGCEPEDAAAGQRFDSVFAQVIKKRPRLR
eukprot:5341442-Alexandrium_andersonii.AAC.1